jgi:arsenite-transporting ATPase
MMGGEASSQEDMFAKLENMRAVITEVNTQFKDPVCLLLNLPCSY